MVLDFLVPINEGTNNNTVTLTPLTRTNEEKDFIGTKKYVFYDKGQELKDKANLREVFLRLPLSEKEINLLSDSAYNPNTQALYLEGLNVLRSEMQFTGTLNISYITRFLDEEAYKADQHLTLSTLLRLLDNGILYEALEAFYKKELEQKIFYDFLETSKVKLNKYEQLLAELMEKESATFYLAMFKECNYEKSLKKVINKIQGVDDNSLYAEMYSQFDLRKL